MLTIGLYGPSDPRGTGASHDHGVALLRDGRVVHCQELERLTRRKHDGHLDEHVEELLRDQLLPDEPVRIVLANSFVGADFRSVGGAVEVHGVTDLEVPDILAECSGAFREVGSSSGSPPAAFFSICHEMAHLGTCLPFFGGFPPDSLLVHVDGGASRSCASAWWYDGTRITCLSHGWHPGLKGAVNNFNASRLSQWILGLTEAEHLSMPGKLMGLASHGAADPAVIDWLDRHEWLREGSRSCDEVLRNIATALPQLHLREFSTTDSGSQTIAACMQRHLEEEILGYIRGFKASCGARHLFYSGGAALNIHANTRVERELGFESVCIPPAPSDSGLALGAAAFLEWWSGSRIHRHSAFLNHLAGDPTQPSTQHGVPVLSTIDEVAQAIERGDIVGVWTGHAELGPRALGHRSLLSRPDSVPLRERLSEAMKRREWYRPVAPMLLPEVALAALEGYKPGSTLARYMLGAWTVHPDWIDPLRGCVHVDGTVRAQVIDPIDPELTHIHRLLTLLRDTHGVQGLINTSFNTRGEPIVHTLNEALRAVEAMGVDALWLPSGS